MKYAHTVTRQMKGKQCLHLGKSCSLGISIDKLFTLGPGLKAWFELNSDRGRSGI